MRIVTRNSAEIMRAYVAIRKARPEWFRVAPMMEPDDFFTFERWMMAYFPFWYEGPGSLVLPTLKDGVIDAHPVFIDRLNLGFLREVLDDMLTKAHRVEVPYTGNGRTVRRVLRELGFSLEGRMRDKVRYVDAKNGQVNFYDVEMWAILAKKGESNG